MVAGTQVRDRNTKCQTVTLLQGDCAGFCHGDRVYKGNGDRLCKGNGDRLCKGNVAGLG